MSSAVDMEHLTVKRFISGPLENTPDVRAGTPPGYNPPSLNRMKQMQSLDGVYHGSSAGSQPDGFGLAVWDTVRKYDGQWQGGWEHGLGREAFYDGSCYGGLVERFRCSGAVLEDEDEEEEAEAEEALAGAAAQRAIDMPSARPKAFPWSAHAPYSPRWGLGAFGWVYSGQFRHGGRHGVGALATADGGLFEGQFAADEKHGFGMRLERDSALWLEAWDQARD
ncbi:hypothetical protein T484DRAFT_1887882 [Baffinella frigidus]|nr:hypothetical protein T484DRAFT_1887882 [Cryptophyta sp. CCMP2293]